MKCYHEGELDAAVSTISLADAMLKVCEYHAVDAFTAGNMIQLSSSARVITVMDGTIHIEDDVPVLDIDKVIEDWFIFKAKLVRALHPHQPFSAMIVCSTGYKDDMTIKYQYSLSYDMEAKGAASEPTFNEFLRRVDWAKANEAKVLAIDHNPIE
jgi:hypothetical protein